MDAILGNRKVLPFNELFKHAEEERQKRIKNLESLSKQLHELVVSESFIVNDAVSESYGTSFTPISEMVIGGHSSAYHGGFTSKLVLKVMPDNQDVPIRTLNFSGISAVRAGDYISAKIPRFREEIFEPLAFYDESPGRGARQFYLDRAFNPEETAIELALLSKDGKVLRIDRAVDYRNFIRE